MQLLSSIIDSRSAAEIDTPAKIQGFVTLTEKIARLVADDRSKALSEDDFTALKISGVKDSNLAAVRDKIFSLSNDGAQ
ncbi:hypothetical protein FEE59_26365, partial [Herbaspirillum sp. RU 5E]|nr:hypothetical protein [Herbaspirillum sp. RU 5E]